jgi:hypothetical protein
MNCQILHKCEGWGVQRRKVNPMEARKGYFNLALSLESTSYLLWALWPVTLHLLSLRSLCKIVVVIPSLWLICLQSTYSPCCSIYAHSPVFHRSCPLECRLHGGRDLDLFTAVSLCLVQSLGGSPEVLNKYLWSEWGMNLRSHWQGPWSPSVREQWGVSLNTEP